MKFASSPLLVVLVLFLSLCAIQEVVFTQNADVTSTIYSGGFRWGINYGYTSGWSDADKINLGPKIGLNSRRVKLPEHHLETWGYDIEVGDCQTARTVGQDKCTAFLIGMSNAHTTNPNPDGSNEAHPPAGLYEAIWLNKTTKTPNPNNYWAAYLVKLWNNYKSYISVYEIWNEPDFTNTWDVTFGRSDNNDWWHRAPLSSELTNWKNTNFFSYIRLLRVTFEVLRTLDPNTKIATGGLGYYSFVDALCRYTDNPVDGSKTSAYPLTGCSYFDTNSIHFYPHNAVYDVTTEVWNKNKDSDTWANSFILHKKNFETVMKKYGYGLWKPWKLTVCTETGVSTSTTSQGGDKLRRNYLMKVAILAQANKVGQIHTYDFNDDGSTGTYQTMGAFGVISTDNKNPNPKSSSIPANLMMAIKFWSGRYDPIRTATLRSQIPAFKSFAFGLLSLNRTIYAIWKPVTVNGSESGETVSAATVTFSSPGSTLKQYNWDWANTKQVKTLTKNSSGKFTSTVDGTPSFFIDDSIGLGANGVPLAVTSVTVTPTATTAVLKFAPPSSGYVPDIYSLRIHKTGTAWPVWVNRQYFQQTFTGLTSKTSYEVQVRAAALTSGPGPIVTKQFTTL